MLDPDIFNHILDENNNSLDPYDPRFYMEKMWQGHGLIPSPVLVIFDNKRVSYACVAVEIPGQKFIYFENDKNKFKHYEYHFETHTYENHYHFQNLSHAKVLLRAAELDKDYQTECFLSLQEQLHIFNRWNKQKSGRFRAVRNLLKLFSYPHIPFKLGYQTINYRDTEIRYNRNNAISIHRKKNYLTYFSVEYYGQYDVFSYSGATEYGFVLGCSYQDLIGVKNSLKLVDSSVLLQTRKILMQELQRLNNKFDKESFSQYILCRRLYDVFA
jgi:hypothetical protein